MKHRAIPTKEQLEWADLEIGVIIHLDIQVFEQNYQFRENWTYTPDAKVFNPISLDTDQWLQAIVDASAKYAILVVKHCSGFCLWPTKQHDYSISKSPWKDGKGDILGDFIASCKKYNMKPGIYYSTTCNAYCNVDNPGKVRTGDLEKQKAYNEMVYQQLKELWSQYGELFELWFDGGVLSVEAGGPDITHLLEHYQPNAVCFQGDTLRDYNNLRWVGNERGEAPENCWSTMNGVHSFDGTIENDVIGMGDKEGSIWIPAEADVPNRKNNRWFYYKDEEDLVYPCTKLLEFYYKTVGRNTNLLLGIPIDHRGLIPDKDVSVLKEFGVELKRRFDVPIISVKGSDALLVLDLQETSLVNHIVLQEDLTNGHRVEAFIVEYFEEDRQAWRELYQGKVIGHKRILAFDTILTQSIRLKCIKVFGKSNSINCSLYHVKELGGRR